MQAPTSSRVGPSWWYTRSKLKSTGEEQVVLKRFLFALMLAVTDAARVFADEMVHIVISEDGLSEHLALKGAIARVPHGTVM